MIIQGKYIAGGRISKAEESEPKEFWKDLPKCQVKYTTVSFLFDTVNKQNRNGTK